MKLHISLVMGNLSLLDRSNDYETQGFAVNTPTNLPPPLSLYWGRSGWADRIEEIPSPQVVLCQLHLDVLWLP